MIDRILEKYYKELAKDFLFITLDMEKTDHAVPRVEVPVPVRQSIAENLQNAGGLSTENVVEGMVHLIGSDGEFRYNDEYFNFLRKCSEKISRYIIGRGIALAGDGKLKEGALYMRTALAIEPDDLDALYNYAKICYNIYHDQSLEQKEKADFKQVSLQLFEMCCEHHPKFTGGYYYLGYFYMNAGLYEKARMTWERYLDLVEENDAAGNSFEVESAGAEKGVAVENEADRQTEIRQRLSQLTDLVQFERGYLAVINGDTDKGLEILTPLLEKEGAGWNVIYFVALAYRKKGELEKAAGLFKQVLFQSPSQAEAMNELALCYAGLSKTEYAEKYFKKALLIKENDPDILGNLAGLYISEGRISEGKEYLARAQALAPEDEILQGWKKVLNDTGEI